MMTAVCWPVHRLSAPKAAPDAAEDAQPPVGRLRAATKVVQLPGMDILLFDKACIGILIARAYRIQNLSYDLQPDEL